MQANPQILQVLNCSSFFKEKVPLISWSILPVMLVWKNSCNFILLQPMLQELGKQNPHLMRLIQEHQADFLRLINEPAEGEG